MENIKKLIETNSEDCILKQSDQYPELSVLKYKRHVFIKDTWNDFLRECRGMVVDQNFNIVSLPFKKIHNFGIEKDAPKISDEEKVQFARKINGFMIAVTWYKGDLLWSTTGSLDSDFVGYAKSIYNSWNPEERSKFRDIIASVSSHTFMFECCVENDPHIIEEEFGLYFIGSRYKSLNSRIDIMSAAFEEKFWQGTPVISCGVHLADMLTVRNMAKNCKHEGFVVYASKGRATKIKSPYYLTKKLFMRGNIDKLLRRDIKQTIDEEYFPLIEWIRVNSDTFSDMDEKTRRLAIETFLGEQ